MKNSILIIGSDGYLGRKVVQKLKSEFNLICFDKYPKFPETTELDINNSDNVKKIFQENDYVVVISLAGLLPGLAKKKVLYKNNLQAGYLSKFIKQSSHFIFASSTAVYRTRSKNSVLGPFEIYGKSKLDAEELVKKYTTNYTIFRIGTMISQDRSGGIMNILNRLARGKAIWLPKSGNVVHPFVDVDDVVEAIALVAKENIRGTFDLVSNDRKSLKTLAFEMNPSQKIYSSKTLDWVFSKFGNDTYPIFGISKWHVNALFYDLRHSKNINVFNKIKFKSMLSAVLNSLKD